MWFAPNLKRDKSNCEIMAGNLKQPSYLLKVVFLLTLTIFYPQVGCGRPERKLTVRTTFINNLQEDVLIKDENFSRGVVPFFLSPADSFNLSRTDEWEAYGEAPLAPGIRNKVSVSYSAFIAGNLGKFDKFHSAKLIEPWLDSTVQLDPKHNATYHDTFRVGLN